MADKITVNETDKSVTLRLRNVRLSFPSLFKATSFDGDESKAKYSASFLMPKDSDEAKACQKGIKEVIRMAFKGKSPGADRVCFKDATSKDYDGYEEGLMFISASNKNKPKVVDVDLTPLDAEDGKPYAGCYVNVSLRLWAQDNKFGKRVNANLRAVQFFKDGEPFGAGAVDVEEEFEDVSASSSDDDWV